MIFYANGFTKLTCLHHSVWSFFTTTHNNNQQRNVPPCWLEIFSRISPLNECWSHPTLGNVLKLTTAKTAAGSSSQTSNGETNSTYPSCSPMPNHPSAPDLQQHYKRQWERSCSQPRCCTSVHQGKPVGPGRCSLNLGQTTHQLKAVVNNPCHGSHFSSFPKQLWSWMGFSILPRNRLCSIIISGLARVPGLVSLLFWHPVPSSFPGSG